MPINRLDAIDPRLAEHFKAANGFHLGLHLVMLCTVGSHSHGTYIPPDQKDSIDDVDLMGFVVPPLRYHLGLDRWEHWVWKFEELDVVIYSLEKAVRLLLKANPNIVGTLWLNEEHYLYRANAFQAMRGARDIFTSRIAGESFSGYAHDQLNKMTAFTADKLFQYEEYTETLKRQGLDPQEVIQADYARLNYWRNTLGVDRAYLEDFRKLHKTHFAGYMGEKRKNLVRKFGYDCKNAGHLIRLLRMGIEFLETGNLQVYRTVDAEELKSIKQGEWSLEKVKAEAERLFKHLAEARANTQLPEQANSLAADLLLQDLHREMLRLQ